VGAALSGARRERRFAAAVFLDLERFRMVNETFGRKSGDGMLREVARRLREAAREQDTVARVGADHFAIAVAGFDHPGDTTHWFIERLERAFATPVVVDGVDGISLWLVLLTTLLTPLALFGSWTSIDTKVKEYAISFLLLELGMLGAFVSLDLFLFYVFWELMLVPMYLIIGIWGGPQRVYAAVKFFLYTMVGSVLMLVAILYLVGAYEDLAGVYSFDLEQLSRVVLPRTTQLVLFSAFALAFAIKVPMFPFHTWLPDAHVEAPTAGSVILAGVMLKMGGYGFLRLAIPLFPVAAHEATPWIAALGAIGVV
jgi:proton-translocating NADH-quinone oxidoreductase chain M